MLKEEIEEATQLKVELQWKAIFCRKQIESTELRSIIRAIYLELDVRNFNKNFKRIMSIYRR